MLRRHPGVSIDPRNAPGRSTILTSTPTPASDDCTAGSYPGPGTYFCLGCGAHLALQEEDPLPTCPGCGGAEFRLDSIFASMQEHQTTAEFTVHAEPTPSWLDEARAGVPPGSRHLICHDGDAKVLDFEIGRGWTRIGRSVAADIRLDDPSVSRRHALLVAEAGKPVRVLDDRSLNGVFVNGEETEWSKLEDGDELAIGRYRLFTLEG